jgi:hypothetical protein
MAPAREWSDDRLDLGNLITSNLRIRAPSMLRLKMRIHDDNCAHIVIVREYRSKNALARNAVALPEP